MVQVYHFKVWNATKGDWKIPPSKRAVENIAELNGEIVSDTVEDVDLALLTAKEDIFLPAPQCMSHVLWTMGR